MTVFRWASCPPGLYRDPEHGRIAGVCAGLGRYFAVRPKFIRLAMILGGVFGLFIPIAIGYGLLVVLLPVAPEPETAGAGPDRHSSSQWPRADDPVVRVEHLKARFHHLDRRLAAMEARVTSDEFLLRQKFRDL